MSKLDTAHGPLVDLIGMGRVFVVPDYQRAYSWRSRKEVAELWSDVVRLYKGVVDNGQNDTHFIGSVVIGKATAKALGPVECPVIDGQQRLITLSLILCAMRDELIADDDKRTAITSQYLAHYKGQEITALRVRPGEKDRVAYEALVRGAGSSNNRGLINAAYKYIVDQLQQGPVEDMDPDEVVPEPDPLESTDEGDDAEAPTDDATTSMVGWDWEVLLGVVGTQLELVSISDVAAENAYQIFATLNSTGLPLAQVDLVRNALFMLMPRGGTKAHQDLWVPMEEVMGKELLQSYLHTWIIRRGHNVPAKEIYRSVVFELSRAGTREADIFKQLKGLHEGAWSYLLISRPETRERARFGPGPDVPSSLVKALARLRTWGTVPMEPVLVELVERFKHQQVSAKQVLNSLAHLESFVVRRFICQTPPNDLRSTFARLTQQVAKKTTATAFEQAVTDGLLEKARRWPSNDDLAAAFLTKPLYRSPGQRQTFFVLKRIAEKYEGKEAPHIVFGVGKSDYSIEHILPQSFPEHWQLDLTRWQDPNPQETWATFRHTAGNLTLTAYNSELSTLPFQDASRPMDKRRWIDQKLRLELSKSVLANTEWTRREVEARSKELCDVAKGIWPYPK